MRRPHTFAVGAAGHVTEVAGPVQALRAYLQRRRIPFAFATHPFGYSSVPASVFEVWSDGEMVERRTARSPRALAIARDLIMNLLWFGTQPRSECFVGIDCLNAATGVVLRWLGKTRLVAYYVIDYTPVRFNNRIVNALYHAVDRFAARNADVVWNISERIAEVHARQGVARAKNVVVGVGVDLEKVHPAVERRPHDLIFVSHLTKSKGAQLVIEAMPEIRRAVPDARLLIVGTGPYERELRELAARQCEGDAIRFLGLMSHDELFAFMPTCGIALATYLDDPNSITHYADPTKPKEYLACGLPVIITDVPWIARLIDERPMGRCISYDRAQLVDAVVRLMSDRQFYRRCVDNAIAFSSTLDWSTIYDRAFAQLSPAIAAAGPTTGEREPPCRGAVEQPPAPAAWVDCAPAGKPAR